MTNLHPGLILILTGVLVFWLPQKVRRWTALAGAFAALGAMVLLNENAACSCWRQRKASFKCRV